MRNEWGIMTGVEVYLVMENVVFYDGVIKDVQGPAIFITS